MSNLALVRARLESYSFERPDSADGFSRRLARENAWSAAYAARVITEYKRFLVLASTSERIVCPSDDVDQVWHLHLLHTRDYRRFCREVLAQRLDHMPSRGGAVERAKYADAYEHTLDEYRRVFGEEPPPDVWPGVTGRFDAERKFVRLDVNSHWVIPMPRFVQKAATRFTELTRLRPRTVTALAALAALGCASDGSDGSSHVLGPAFLGLYITGWVGSLCAAYYVNTGGLHRDDRMHPELDAYEAAYLSGEGVQAVDSAIAMLVASGAASFDASSGELLAQGHLAPGAHPLEAAIYARLSFATPVLIGTIRGEAEVLTAAIAERLKSSGLITDTPSRLPLLIALAAPVVGIGRIVSRIGTPYPVGFLVLLTLLGFVVALVAFRPSRLTPDGRRLLKTLKSAHRELPRSGSPAKLAATGMLALAVGLFGFSALAQGTELDSLRTWMQKPPAQGGGGGCGGGGCGGGGCGGGGCGGCGGCGG